jgi:hypothetical protein
MNPDQFNLEKAIADWRQEMTAGGINSSAALDELETHLREECEQLIGSGRDPAAAFAVAVAKIGNAGPLKAEFKAAAGRFNFQPGKLTGIACGAVATLFSLLLMGQLLTIHEATLPMRLLGLSAIVPVLFAWRYGPRVLPVVPRRRLRTAIGLVCCATGIAWMALFIKFILPRFLEPGFNSQIVPDLVMASFLWAWTVVAVLGGVAWGLEKAAGPQTASD